MVRHIIIYYTLVYIVRTANNYFLSRKEEKRKDMSGDNSIYGLVLCINIIILKIKYFY